MSTRDKCFNQEILEPWCDLAAGFINQAGV